ncbi:MAG TPA: DUF4162 domain-containing protein, partial [Pirellulales bacterium]|nr:DUF4162 domain-containing protein [Pirellulales bacterium]
LDPRARLEVKALLKELRRMGKTILISSHILSELADCCTSIGILERGQLLLTGPIDDVYRRIRSTRVIELRPLGDMEAALAALRSVPGLEDLQASGRRITIEISGSDEDLAQLLEQLLSAGIRLHSFAEKDPTLEDVFMLVTKGLVI